MDSGTEVTPGKSHIRNFLRQWMSGVHPAIRAVGQVPGSLLFRAPGGR